LSRRPSPLAHLRSLGGTRPGGAGRRQQPVAPGDRQRAAPSLISLAPVPAALAAEYATFLVTGFHAGPDSGRNFQLQASATMPITYT
jgi:hypothetical protein